jgi:ribulose-5-phosphate 4-epimerase/fuculose-1-phosphate aldolase
MAKKKTSAEMAREQSELAKVEGMLGDAFGDLGDLEQSTTEEITAEFEEPVLHETDDESDQISDSTESNDSEQESNDSGAEITDLPAESENTDGVLAVESPSSPPTGPPLSPPSGPPSKGPPSGPPSNTPSGPPSKGPPSKPPAGPPSNVPSGPPSKGPPSKPPAGPPSDKDEETTSNPSDGETLTEDTNAQESEQKTEEKDDSEEAVSNVLPNDVKESETAEEIKPDEETIEQAEDVVTEGESAETPIEEPMNIEENSSLDGEEGILLKEAEIARLAAEVERLRSSMVGAAEVIEELENPPMPPIVEEDVVIAAHTVADIARMARQLDRDELVRASMGAIAMLHPESPEILISTKHSAMLPRMNEKDICAGKLGGKSPRGAPEDWRVLEVLLASASLVTGGPAAVIHAHGPYTTAVSCERDLVLMQPIDEIGKEHIGKIIIVDPDPENPEEFLRQVAEALQQGGMRCVVVRGKGSYAVGADLDQAWANAAMLEHSMKIVMLARQANLKV